MAAQKLDLTFEIYSRLGNISRNEGNFIYEAINSMREIGYDIESMRDASELLGYWLKIPSQPEVRNQFRRIVNRKKILLIRRPIRLFEFTEGNAPKLSFFYGDTAIVFSRQ